MYAWYDGAEDWKKNLKITDVLDYCEYRDSYMPIQLCAQPGDEVLAKLLLEHGRPAHH